MDQSAGLKIEKCGMHESGGFFTEPSCLVDGTGWKRPVALVQVGCSQAGTPEPAEHAEKAAR
jgi:hypothetical protein